MLKSVKKMHMFKWSLIMFLMCIHLHVSFVEKKKEKNIMRINIKIYQC